MEGGEKQSFYFYIPPTFVMRTFFMSLRQTGAGVQVSPASTESSWMVVLEIYWGGATKLEQRFSDLLHANTLTSTSGQNLSVQQPHVR